LDRLAHALRRVDGPGSGPAPRPHSITLGRVESENGDEVLRLQRLAGNRAVGELLGVQRAPGSRRRRRKHAAGRKPRSKAPRSKAPSADERRRARATSLKAADARALLKDRLPFALAAMSESQVGQMQRVLDAAVINPEVDREAAAIDRKSVIRDFGYRQDRDPTMVRQAAKVRKDRVATSNADTRIRLDHQLLLAKDALSPRTDNPDEQNYLNRVANTIATRGIYLRFTPKAIRDPEDPSVWTVDPRNFETWLSLGPNGDNEGRPGRP